MSKCLISVLARFRASASGQRLLASRSNILSILGDRALLERMPQGSLGRAYLAFIDHEQISADGLVQASEEGRTGNFLRVGDFDYVSNRLRDTAPTLPKLHALLGRLLEAEHLLLPSGLKGSSLFAPELPQ